MLFPFFADALSHNWIGPLVTKTLSQGMTAIDVGQPIPAWPPLAMTADRQSWLRRHSGFNKKIKKFFSEYQKLAGPDRALIQQALTDQTNLPAILSNQQVCAVLAGVAVIEKAIKELFEYAFGQLSCDDDSGSPVRDRHYSDIYDQLPDRVCPFCGLSPMRGKNGPRPHLDHWMAFSLYPFAGADLRNLCPMCETCNATFKGVEDILHNAAKARRVSTNPYQGPTYKVVLSNSEWGRGNELKKHLHPRWQIDFVGNPPEQAETWDDVFKIRSRYRDDVLDPEFLPWLKNFARWFNGQTGFARTSEGIAKSFQPYIDQVIQEQFADKAFLKAEVFRFLAKACQSAQYGEDVTGLLLSIADNIR